MHCILLATESRLKVSTREANRRIENAENARLVSAT